MGATGCDISLWRELRSRARSVLAQLGNRTANPLTARQRSVRGSFFKPMLARSALPSPALWTFDGNP
jgi:hypothetical protein